MKKLALVLTLLAFTLGFSVTAFAAEGTDPSADQVQTTIENAVVYDSNTDNSAAISEAKDDNLSVVEAKSLKKKFVNEYKTLYELRAECKALWAGLKAKNVEIKSAWANLKASIKGKTAEERKAILSDVNSKLAPYREIVKADHAAIKSIRAEKKVAWTDYRTAIKAKDTVKAKDAIDRILVLKGQIIEKQKELMAQKTEILNIVNSGIVQ